MNNDPEMNNVLKGLVLHFLHRKTIGEAIEQARSEGVPEEQYESLPAIMSEITSAAEDVVAGLRTRDEVVDEISRRESRNETERKAAKTNVARLMDMTLTFMNELGVEKASDDSLPEMYVPWFRYVPKSNQQ